MSSVRLPTELLDQIFGYLDWNRDEDLYPSKQSVITSSVTCKQLRKVLAPLVFQDVTLKICWAGGVLVSPALLKVYGSSYFTQEAMGRTALQRLTLASAEKMSLLPRNSRWLQEGLDCWISASDTILTLNLKNIATNSPDLAAFIAKFTQLKHLHISHVVLSPLQRRGYGRVAPEVQDRIWLRLSIDVRHAVTWLQQAVIGERLLDADREERLLEDFGSFLPLWAAKADLERGPKAVNEWTRKTGYRRSA
ncbi:uncharacterized protein MYCFIDRAFT_75550 [Pseudocercospora fijiensis CIRAD86]|uniref:F-box domain-containing protein n=1 Tax=Pseudocercospora fijiensis (strain CIRAD86) TaxID=383855 RepID=N1Q7Q9_PSEFD|nr:uncharacterized protein MYCFIDRAFT_75550 [Pseudocercospora fijiensis CIRAD86]EME87706.1 hypothetical protein MYCFIDRAFT_75550 [Pseudocercospora fijiensis CIRAD86]